MRYYSPEKIQYSVKAIDGTSIGGWERFFKTIVNKQKDFAIAEDEVVIILQNQTEPTGYKGSYEFIKADKLYPSPTLFPSTTLFPGGTIIFKEVKND